MKKEEVLNEFYRLTRYLAATGRVRDPVSYRRNIPAFLSFAIHLEAYRRAVQFCAGKRVLDVGSFIGYGEKVLAPHVQEAVAIDNDAAAIETARRNCDLSNVRFKHVMAGRLPFPDGAFEIVLGFQVIEHLRPGELNVFLRELKRVTNQGGILILVTPNRAFRLLPFQCPFNREHYQEFTANGFHKVLQPVFNEIRIHGIRAKKWIEEIERKRVRQSPFRVYLRDPICKIAWAVIPSGLRDRLRGAGTVFSGGKKAVANENNFAAFFRSFSMDDFYLSEGDLNKSIDLFAVCKKP